MRILSKIFGDTSGTALTEFALGAPFLLMAGLWGTETANFALVNMKIGQLATHVADNASRIGDTSTVTDRKIYESDINDLIYGAQIQGGPAIALYDHGRVIISSLESGGPDSEADEQYIHWQRCRGAKTVTSSYGDEGDVMPNGMGPPDQQVMAMEDDGLIFVEINYTYQPLISASFLGSPEIRSFASFAIRDDRDLSDIFQRDPARPDPVQRCTIYKGNVQIATNGVMS